MANCKKKKCGCLDTGLTTPTPCAHDTLECPLPDPCPETFSDCCVVHDGDGIAEFNIQTGDRLCDILQKIALAYSPGAPGTSIVDIIDNEDGTMTIIMSDGTEYIITLPSSAPPSDDWVLVQNNEFVSKVFTGTDATTLVGSLDDDRCEIAYQVISEHSILLHGVLDININIDHEDPEFDGGSFTITLLFPPITSPGGWFIGNKLTASIFPVPTPDVHTGAFRVSESGSAIKSVPVTISATNTGGNNRLILSFFPDLTESSTNTAVNVRFATNVRIIPSP